MNGLQKLHTWFCNCYMFTSWRNFKSRPLQEVVLHNIALILDYLHSILSYPWDCLDLRRQPLRILKIRSTHLLHPISRFLDTVDKTLLRFCGLFGQSTGKSLSEPLILALTNPQYDKRLFIGVQVQCMKIFCHILGQLMKE